MALLTALAVAVPVAPAHGAGDAPVANDDSRTVSEDGTLDVSAPGVLGNDTDTENDGLTATVTNDVDNGSLDLNADGSFTYEPANNFDGTDSFSYVANDGTSDSNTATVTLTVTPVNDAPSVVNRTLSTGEGDALGFTLTGTDVDDDSGDLTFAVVNDVDNGSLNCSSGGACTYTPGVNYAGLDSFTYRATDPDGELSNVATASITVTTVNDPPVATGATVNTTEDTPVDFSLSASDPDDAASSLTFAVTNPPDRGSLDCDSGGDCTYDPTTNLFGADSFTFRATDPDNAPSNIATVNINVAAVNDAPVAQAQSVSASQNTATVIQLGATDVDDTVVSLTWAVVASPLHGNVNCNANTGACGYTPDAGYSGADSFTFRANDGTANSNTATVSISVANVNDPPVATNLLVGTAEDTPRTFALQATDPDNDDLTFVVVTQPANGAVSCNAAGSCTYTPDADFGGTDSFTFRARDTSDALSNVATVTIGVSDENDPPVAANQTVSTAEDTVVVISLGAIDPEGQTVNYALDVRPTNGAVVCSSTSGRCEYTPNEDYTGPDFFTFHASDGVASSNIARINVNVTQVNDPPFATIASFTTPFNQRLRVDPPGLLTGDIDPENDALTAVIADQPTNGTVNVRADGSFTYDPDPNFKGIDTFTYRAQDPSGAASRPATVTIAVDVDATGTDPVIFVGTADAEARGFTSSLPRGLRADLRGAGDAYAVFFGRLQGVVQVIDTGTAGTDKLTTLGGAANESIRVNGPKVRNGDERVDYAGIEALDVRGQRGDDRIALGTSSFPASVDTVSLDGGEGNDKLFVDAGGRAAQIRGNTVIVAGWPTITYTGFERVDLNSTVTGTRTLSSGGYWLLASDGGVFTFGDAKFYGSTGGLNLKAPIIQMVASPSGKGYWLLASDGGVFTFGDAKFYGSTGGLRLRSPVVQMITTPSGKGYWLRASDGGIFTFGDAKFYGSTGSLSLSVPIIEMVPSPSGNGYWLLAANGAVFGFGAAGFHGSTNTLALPARTVELVPTPTGKGYWLLSADGAVFAFGDAGYYGSMIGKPVNAEVVQMVATPTGHGYWLLGRDGGIFTFGDAKFHGSTGGLQLRQPISRMVVRG